MTAYIIRRLLLIIPTLFGIMVINFFIVQAAPGGPVEQMIAVIKGTAVSATARVSGTATGDVSSQSGERGAPGSAADAATSKYRGARGLDPDLIKEIEKLYGFDKPPYERFIHMMKSYVVFDFGDSFFRDRKVVDLVIEKCGPARWSSSATPSRGSCSPSCWLCCSPAAAISTGSPCAA